MVSGFFVVKSWSWFVPDDPVVAAAGEGSHPSMAGTSCSWGSPLAGGLSVWPRVVGGERHVQALPHLWCDVVVGSSA